MRTPYEVFIGLRYTRSRRKAGLSTGFISFISTLSVAGIALGVATLIIVLSVVNGFQKEVRDRMLSVIAHAEIVRVDRAMPDWRAVVTLAKTHPAVMSGAPYVAGQGMIVRDSMMAGVLVRGIAPELETSVSDIGAKFVEGSIESLQDGSRRVVIGKALARQIGASLNEGLSLLVSRGGGGLSGVLPRVQQFQISGIFESGHFEYDSNLLLVSLSDASELFEVRGVSGVRLRLTDLDEAPRVSRELMRMLDTSFYVRDWSFENRNWFISLHLQKRMMFVIMALIVAVAAFNLVSMLVMTVTDKRGDIAIMRTLGSTQWSIAAIFVVQGTLLGLLGTVIGVVLGVLISLNVATLVKAIEATLGFEALPQSIYLLDHMPSDLRLEDVLWVSCVAFGLAFAATLYPSLRASRLSPSATLQNE